VRVQGGPVGKRTDARVPATLYKEAEAGKDPALWKKAKAG